jgi:hypothetical protein
MDYKKLNNYTGWAVFLIATLTYIFTLEPTTSLWDCGEYITTAYKLEVGHPPGAPLFMMLGRLFTVFVGPDSAAYMVNLMSALSSSFTILFLFWSITMLGKKITLSDDGNLFSNPLASLEGTGVKDSKKTILTKGQMIAVVASGLIGALAYTFTDSFWFSAVEGEVYAMSSFFTAIVVWAILKWDSELTNQENEPDNLDLQSNNANRWIVFIFFMIGLSIGVHLLNLLVIPAIAYIIYFKKFKPSIAGFLLTGIIGIATLGIIQAGVIPKIIQLAGSIERYFTNSLGMPFNSGAIFFFMLMTAIIVGLILFSKKSGNHILNTVTWSFSMILIGYSCFAMIVIRSNANTPLDENDPENLVSLEAYLKREQYGDWPILYGQYFNAELEKDRAKWKDRSDVYLKRYVVQKNNGNLDVAGFVEEAEAIAFQEKNGGDIVQKYYQTFSGDHLKPVYEDKGSTFFPRMYSSEPRHVRGYVNWSGAKANRTPTFGQNLTYFADYQVGWMYWRYFMWNFSGRQSDEQGHGNSLHGNWITGLNFIDQHHIGDQSEVPSIISTNPSNNKFYLLPLILGFIGFIFTLMKGSKSWWFVMLLFLLTGFAVIFYLNQKPMEPRERDYAYAASFYAFSFWIGLSVLGLYDAYKNMKLKDLGMITAVLVGFSLILLIGDTTAGLAMIYMTFVIVAAFGLMVAMRNGIKNEMQSAIIATLICLPVPILMAVQGWDDHNRSNRYTAQALAENYLNSCSEGSIIYTNGDNDTFPLWYLQEVEGKKTSVRVCNLSLLNTDWYTNQMTKRAYESAPLPISFKEHEFRQNGYLDYMYVQGTNDLTMGAVTLDATAKKIVEDKIKFNPELFNSGFKTAADNLFMILSRSALAVNQPELVQNVSGFDKKGNYFAFRKFIFDLLEQGQSLELKQEELQAVQNVMIVFNNTFDYLPVKYIINYLHNTDNLYDRNGQKFFVLPTGGMLLEVDKAKIAELANNDNPDDDVVSKKDLDRVVDVMRWKLPKSTLYKADLMILDMVANFNWERNIYFAGSAAKTTYLGLENYFFAEGLVYKLVPVQTIANRNPNSYGEVNEEVMYDNLVNKFHWGNMEKDGVLVDYYSRRSTNNYRVNFSVLADAYVEIYDISNQKLSYFEQILSQEGGLSNDTIQTPLGMYTRGDIPAEVNRTKNDIEDARVKVSEILDKAFEVMPNNKVPFGRIIPYYITAYYSVGDTAKGNQYANQALDLYAEELDYFVSLNSEFSGTMIQEMFGVYRSVFSIFQTTGLGGTDEAIAEKSNEMLTNYMAKIERIKFPKGSRTIYDQTFGGFFKQIGGMMQQQP